MKTISLSLPPGSKTTGQLLRTYAGAEKLLHQDILQVSLPNGVVIDVGREPEYCSDGHFQIVVYRGYWEDQLRKPVGVADPVKAAGIVETLAARYNDAAYKRMPSKRVGTQGVRYVNRGMGKAQTASFGSEFLEIACFPYKRSYATALPASAHPRG